MAGSPEGCAWQFLCPFRKAWVDVSPEEEAQLRQGHLRRAEGQAEVQYLLHGVRFRADFSEMTRTNVASKRSMPLRLRGVAPPPALLAAAAAARPAASGAGATAERTPSGAAPAAAAPEAAALAPDALVTPDGKPVPVAVRRAWGHGVPEGFSMSGAFEFTLQLAERDRLGELLSWHMLSAGVDPQFMESASLTFTDRRGQAAVGSREAVQSMLERDASFPVRVTYAPRKVYSGLEPQKMIEYEVYRTHLLAVKEAVKALGANLHNVKHRHQKKTFERYLLYLEDHYYQTDDDLSDALRMGELCARYPHLAPHFALTSKTVDNLVRVLRGEVDILEYLFGG